MHTLTWSIRQCQIQYNSHLVFLRQTILSACNHQHWYCHLTMQINTSLLTQTADSCRKDSDLHRRVRGQELKRPVCQLTMCSPFLPEECCSCRLRVFCGQPSLPCDKRWDLHDCSDDAMLRWQSGHRLMPSSAATV